MEKRIRVLVPLPSYGFDPTEVAVPCKMLAASGGYDLTFATPEGKQAVPDDLMLTGNKLGLLRGVLRARADAVDAFRELEASEAFANPVLYSNVKAEDFDALLLPGGHDKGVREYLESAALQGVVADFFQNLKPVGAICHGTVLAARSMVAATQKSVLHGYKTTCLLQSQELLAYNLTRLWLSDYYLTYPGNTVQTEVTASLSDKSCLVTGPSPMLRDDLNNLSRGFCVRDRNYVSARWPGDVYSFSLEFIRACEMFRDGQPW